MGLAQKAAVSLLQGFGIRYSHRLGWRLLRSLPCAHGGNAPERPHFGAVHQKNSRWRGQQNQGAGERAGWQGCVAAQAKRDDENGGIDSSVHARYRRCELSAGRNLFRPRKSEGRTRFLYQQPWRGHALPDEDPRAQLCEPEHHPENLPRLSRQRHRGDSGFARFCDGRVRPMNATHTEPIPNPLRQQGGFAVPAALEAEVDELITHYPEKRAASLMVLHAIQEQFGWI